MSEEQVAEVSTEEVAPSGTSDNWRSMIPEEIRDHKSLSTIEDVGSLAKGFVHAQSMIGADKIALPGKSSTADDWNAVYSKLGRPEDPSGYQIDYTPPEGVQPDDGVVQWFMGVAHEAGLNNTQAQLIMDRYGGRLGELVGQDNAHTEQIQADTELELKREWGEAYEDQLGLANAALETFGELDFAETPMPDGTMLGDHPSFIRFLANIGSFIHEKVSEDTLEGVKMTGGQTPDEMREELAQLRAPGTPYWDNRHPEHDFQVRRAFEIEEKIAAISA